MAKSEKKAVDSINKLIIRELKNGRQPYSEVAEKLKLTENTVRTRVNKLVDDGILSFVGEINPRNFSDIQIAFMGIKVKTMDMERKAKELTNLKGVVYCAVVTGRYDLILQLELSEGEGYSLLDFFKTELVKVSEISEVETFIVYQSHNMSVPYLL